MNDTIYKRQNDEDILELLYAQRVSYDKAEIYNRISWAIILLLFLQEICKIAIPIIERYSWISCAALAVVLFIMERRTAKYIGQGANLKNLIDCILFDFPIDNNKREELMDYALDLRSKNEAKYQLQTSHDGDDEIKGVKNWYTLYRSENHYEVILNCQKENLWWNKNLVRYYKTALTIIILIFLISIILSVWFSGITISFIFGVAILISTILFPCIRQVIAVRDYTRAMNSASGKLDILEKQEKYLDKDTLQSLQEDIDTIRSSVFLIPNWIHGLYSVRLHRKKRALNKCMSEQ